MAHMVEASPQQELQETAEARRRRERAELLKRAGVQPARRSAYRPDRRAVKPYPRWVSRLAELFT